MKMQECLAYWGILYSERWTSPILGIVNPGKARVGRQDLLRLLLLTHPVMHLVTSPSTDMESTMLVIFSSSGALGEWIFPEGIRKHSRGA